MLISGKAGGGKSTWVYELAWQIAKARGRWAHWLDREMDRNEVVVLAERLGLDISGMLYIGEDDQGTAPRWEDALSMIREPAAIVVDSLQKWASSEADQIRLMEALKCWKARGVPTLVISHSAKDGIGDASGRALKQYDADATVIVERGKRAVRIVVQKARWGGPTPRVVKVKHADLLERNVEIPEV